MRAVLSGALLALCAEIAVALCVFFNLVAAPEVPWSLLPAAVFMVFLWRSLSGEDLPPEAAESRRLRLRAGMPAWSSWPWAFLSMLGMAAVVGLSPRSREIFAIILPPPSRLPEMGDLTVWTLFAANALLFAPLIEEAAFRGYMQVPLEGKVPTFVALGLPALLFTLLHAGRGVGLELPLVAVYLGVLAFRTGSIWPGVVAHTLYNLIALLPPPLAAERLSPAGAGALSLLTLGLTLLALSRLGRPEAE